MSKMHRAVLVGCGNISRTWLNAVKEIGAPEIIGFADINEDNAVQRRQEFGYTEAATSADFKQLIKDMKPDIVFDCTVPEVHVEVATFALEQGCHVLGEKPLADSMENARKITEAAKAFGKIHAVTQNRRYNPNIRAFHDAIASGKFGELTTLNCDFYIGAHFGGFRDRMKHVLLVDMAIHTMDQARFISECDPVSVYCKEWNPKGSWYDYDASAVAIFEMSNDVVFTYRGSWCSEGLNTEWESEWRAVCSKGSVKWNGSDRFEAQAVKKTGGFFSEMEDIPIFPKPDAKSGSHKGVIEEFLRCVNTGEEPETICFDNIKSLAMVFAAVESAERGEKVKIEF